MIKLWVRIVGRSVSASVKLPLGGFGTAAPMKGSHGMSCVNVYCPVCRRLAGRDKLLFKKEQGAEGKVSIRCRGCKREIEIDLGEEPVSR